MFSSLSVRPRLCAVVAPPNDPLSSTATVCGHFLLQWINKFSPIILIIHRSPPGRRDLLGSTRGIQPPVWSLGASGGSTILQVGIVKIVAQNFTGIERRNSVAKIALVNIHFAHWTYEAMASAGIHQRKITCSGGETQGTARTSNVCLSLSSLLL